MPIENIISKHEGAGTATDEVLAQQKRLRDSLWPLLYLIVKANAILAAITQQHFKLWSVVRRRNDKDVSDARQHEGA